MFTNGTSFSRGAWPGPDKGEIIACRKDWHAYTNRLCLKAIESNPALLETAQGLNPDFRLESFGGYVAAGQQELKNEISSKALPITVDALTNLAIDSGILELTDFEMERLVGFLQGISAKVEKLASPDYKIVQAARRFLHGEHPIPDVLLKNAAITTYDSIERLGTAMHTYWNGELAAAYRVEARLSTRFQERQMLAGLLADLKMTATSRIVTYREMAEAVFARAANSGG